MSLTGTWKSTYGTLKIYETQGIISGIYRDLGVLEGRRDGDIVLGTFTNTGKSGRFAWRIEADDGGFYGCWAWGPQGDLTLPAPSALEGDDIWTGVKKSGRVDVETGGEGPWQGGWASNRGPLYLAQHGTRVLGLYDTVGIFEGEASGDRLTGRFTTFGEEAKIVLHAYDKGAAAHGFYRYENGNGEEEVWQMSRMGPAARVEEPKPRRSKTGEPC